MKDGKVQEEYKKKKKLGMLLKINWVLNFMLHLFMMKNT